MPSYVFKASERCGGASHAKFSAFKESSVAMGANVIVPVGRTCGRLGSRDRGRLLRSGRRVYASLRDSALCMNKGTACVFNGWEMLEISFEVPNNNVDVGMFDLVSRKRVKEASA